MKAKRFLYLICSVALMFMTATQQYAHNDGMLINAIDTSAIVADTLEQDPCTLRAVVKKKVLFVTVKKVIISCTAPTCEEAQDCLNKEIANEK